MKKRATRLALGLMIAAASAGPAQALDAQHLLRSLSHEPGLQVLALRQAASIGPGMSALLYTDERALDAAGGAALRKVLKRGHPVLVLLSATPLASHRQGLLMVTGVRPRAGAVVLTQGRSGEIETNVIQMEDDRLASAAIAALVQHARQRPAGGTVRTKRAAAATDGTGGTLAPQLRRVVNVVGLDGQVTSVITLSVVRNVSRTGDVKTLIAKTRTSLNPDGAGISNGTVTGENLWASRLPVMYTLGHSLTATGGVSPVLETYLPEADGRTEFNYARTDERSFSIAGSVGAEFGGGATPEQALQWTAQSPFSLNASYTVGHSETLSHVFQDYSLRVARQSPEVAWELPLAGRLGQHVLVRPTASLPVFRPEALTPMMRNATMDALSVWQVPGRYDGTVTFAQKGGFSIHEDRWHYERGRLVRGESTTPAADELKVDVAMGGWELAREIPVLLQSAQGTGSCIRAIGNGDVGLAPCDSGDETMMWGFDQVRRYHNLATGRCLAYNPSRKKVEQQDCALVNNQYWEWRAERLHSAYNLLWRLYVTSSNTVALEPDGSFVLQDQPVNQFNSLDIPWSSYPTRPSVGDTMPNRNSISPKISPEWVTLYNTDVTPSQLWQAIVVSRALQD